jgi:ABC-type bacteriocin/lantibiotic exporter with double-glycine peptidase domain
LLKQPKLLILDDFGEYFDKKQRKIIADYLFSFNKMTIIYCTNDEYLLKQSDKILCLNEGVCNEINSFEELKKAELYNIVNK